MDISTDSHWTFLGTVIGHFPGQSSDISTDSHRTFPRTVIGHFHGQSLGIFTDTHWTFPRTVIGHFHGQSLDIMRDSHWTFALTAYMSTDIRTTTDISSGNIHLIGSTYIHHSARVKRWRTSSRIVSVSIVHGWLRPKARGTAENCDPFHFPCSRPASLIHSTELASLRGGLANSRIQTH